MFGWFRNYYNLDVKKVETKKENVKTVGEKIKEKEDQYKKLIIDINNFDNNIFLFGKIEKLLEKYNIYFDLVNLTVIDKLKNEIAYLIEKSKRLNIVLVNIDNDNNYINNFILIHDDVIIKLNKLYKNITNYDYGVFYLNIPFRGLKKDCNSNDLIFLGNLDMNSIDEEKFILRYKKARVLNKYMYFLEVEHKITKVINVYLVHYEK